MNLQAIKGEVVFAQHFRNVLYVAANAWLRKAKCCKMWVVAKCAMENCKTYFTQSKNTLHAVPKRTRHGCEYEQSALCIVASFCKAPKPYLQRTLCVFAKLSHSRTHRETFLLFLAAWFSSSCKEWTISNTLPSHKAHNWWKDLRAWLFMNANLHFYAFEKYFRSPFTCKLESF